MSRRPPIVRDARTLAGAKSTSRIASFPFEILPTALPSSNVPPTRRGVWQTAPTTPIDDVRELWRLAELPGACPGLAKDGGVRFQNTSRTLDYLYRRMPKYFDRTTVEEGVATQRGLNVFADHGRHLVRYGSSRAGSPAFEHFVTIPDWVADAVAYPCDPHAGEIVEAAKRSRARRARDARSDYDPFPATTGSTSSPATSTTASTSTSTGVPVVVVDTRTSGTAPSTTVVTASGTVVQTATAAGTAASPSGSPTSTPLPSGAVGGGTLPYETGAAPEATDGPTANASDTPKLSPLLVAGAVAAGLWFMTRGGGGLQATRGKRVETVTTELS